MTQLQTAPAARPFALGSGEGERIWFLNSEMTIKATAATTGGDLFLMETHIPEGFSPPLHVHHDEHEAFYVLEGELDIVCGPERYRATPGAFAFLPSGVAHTFRAVAEARILTIAAPSTSPRSRRSRRSSTTSLSARRSARRKRLDDHAPLRGITQNRDRAVCERP